MGDVSAKDLRPQVLVADDHAMFAEALRVYLEKTYTVVGVVLDGRAMVEAAIRLRARLDYCGCRDAAAEWLGCGPKGQRASSKRQIHILNHAG